MPGSQRRQHVLYNNPPGTRSSKQRRDVSWIVNSWSWCGLRSWAFRFLERSIGFTQQGEEHPFHGLGSGMKGIKGHIDYYITGLFETFFALQNWGEDDQMILHFKMTMVHIFQMGGSTTKWNGKFDAGIPFLKAGFKIRCFRSDSHGSDHEVLTDKGGNLQHTPSNVPSKNR